MHLYIFLGNKHVMKYVNIMKHSVLSMVRKSQSHEFMSTLVMKSLVFMSDLNRALLIELVLPSRLLSISPLEGAKVADSGGGVGRVHRPL